MIMRSSVLLLALVAIVAVVAQTPFALLEAEHGCPDSNPGLVNFTISYSEGAVVKVSPPKKKAHPGDALRFNLFGKFGKLVGVDGKDTPAEWIDGEGKNLRFYVCVPSDILPEDVDEVDYEYGVTAEGSHPLDPVVTIHRF